MTATDPKVPAATPAAPARPARKAAAKPALPRSGSKAAAPAARPAKVVKAPKVAKAAKPSPAPEPALRMAPLVPEALKPAKSAEPKKPKLVRDSFTIPRSEYQLLQDLKQRAASLGRPAKKSEVLRAGVMALAALDDATFLAALTVVPVIKTGRPAKN